MLWVLLDSFPLLMAIMASLSIQLSQVYVSCLKVVAIRLAENVVRE